jgi:membrane-associated phospholipid phosphatase
MRSTRDLTWWAAGCVAVAAVVRLLAFGPEWAQRADVRLFDALSAAPGTAPYGLAKALVASFEPASFALLVLIVAGVAAAGGRAAAGATAVATVLAAAVTTEGLKHLLATPRPGVPSLPADAWPSGHATAAAALAAALLIVTPPGRRRPVAIAGVLLVGAMALALVGLGIHYPSDVAGGVCVAALWGAAALTWGPGGRSGAGGRPAASAAPGRGRRRARRT